MQTESCLFFLRPHTAFIFVWNILGIYSKYSLQFSLTFIFKDTLKKKKTVRQAQIWLQQRRKIELINPHNFTLEVGQDSHHKGDS